MFYLWYDSQEIFSKSFKCNLQTASNKISWRFILLMYVHNVLLKSLLYELSIHILCRAFVIYISKNKQQWSGCRKLKIFVHVSLYKQLIGYLINIYIVTCIEVSLLGSNPLFAPFHIMNTLQYITLESSTGFNSPPKYKTF